MGKFVSSEGSEGSEGKEGGTDSTLLTQTNCLEFYCSELIKKNNDLNKKTTHSNKILLLTF